MSGHAVGMKQVSYPYFIAFISLLNNMELVKQIYTSAAKNNLDAELTKGMNGQRGPVNGGSVVGSQSLAVSHWRSVIGSQILAVSH